MMNMRSKSIVAATAAAVVFTGLGIGPIQAGSSAPRPMIAGPNDTGAMPITDFSSRQRYYRGHNNAAALGTFLAIAGTVAAVAAANHNRRHYGYYDGYYGGGPYGYGAPYGYYGPRYYRGW